MLRRRYVALCALGVGGGLAGCTNGDGDPGSGGDVYERAFREALTEENVEIHTLQNDERRVELVYSPGGLGPDADEDDYRARVEETINVVARAFFDRVYGGWEVDLLDATVRVEGSVVATWQMRREWIQGYLDGDLTRDEMGAKVEASVERHRGTPTE